MKNIKEFIALVDKVIAINEADILDDTKYELIFSGSIRGAINSTGINYMYDPPYHAEDYERLQILVQGMKAKRDELEKIAHLFQ